MWDSEQMMQVIQMFRHATPTMQYESKHNPFVTTFDNAFVDIKEKCYIMWEAQFLLLQEL
jgi:hypothetical protein